MCVSLVANVEAWWSSVPIEIQSALIQGGGTMLAAVLAIGGLIIQLRSQAKQSRQTILETEARKLKMHMYEQGLSVAREVVNKALDFSTTVLRLSTDLQSEALGIRGGYPAPPTNIEFRQLLVEHGAFSEAGIQFAYLIENHRVIDPRITIFRDALSAILHDTRELVNGAFIPHVMRVLPRTVTDGRILREEVSLDRLDRAAAILKEMHSRLHGVTTLMEDFNVEIQNLLLGDIFNRRVEHRKPIDPASLVVTVEKHAEITVALADTPWGHMCRDEEAKAQKKFGSTETPVG